MEPTAYRQCVGMMVFNQHGHVFVAARLDNPADAWQMPQGGIDKGEDTRTAALRELEEEIGTSDVEILAESDDWLRYDLPDHLMGKLWKGKYRGQEQKWFAMRFLGDDSDINIETDHPEFRAWKWVPLTEVPTLIVPFKKALYETLVDRFRSLPETIAFR